MLNTEILNTHLFQSKFMVPVTQEHVSSWSLYSQLIVFEARSLVRFIVQPYIFIVTLLCRFSSLLNRSVVLTYNHAVVTYSHVVVIYSHVVLTYSHVVVSIESLPPSIFHSPCGSPELGDLEQSLAISDSSLSKQEYDNMKKC